MRKLLIFSLVILFAFSCRSRRHYTTAGYENLATAHQTAAVLPVISLTTGRIPEKWPAEDLQQVEEAESKALQNALFNEIARRGGTYRGDIRLNLQHPHETNALLNQAGYTLRQSWDLPASELANLLGVEAVIRTTVEKQRYLTDLEGLAVSLGTSLLYGLVNMPFGIGQLSRTSQVWANASVVDAKTGVAVWTTRVECPTHWNVRHQDIVDNIARRMARRFPYRLGE